MPLPLRNPNTELNKLLAAAKAGRLPYDSEGWLNIAFYLNKQYVEWNAEVATIREIPRRSAKDETPRPVVNKIMHFVRQAHNDVLQDEPTPDVLPPTDDYGDISDAQVARAWCDQQAGETVTDYIGKLSRAALWSILCGSGYLKWCVTPDGELRIVPPSFFEVYLDPYAKQFADVRHIIHSQFMDAEQVYEMYGREVKHDAVEKADADRTALLQGMGCAPVLNGVTVNELWQKPSRRHPKGQYAVWAGREQLVPPGPLPYPHLIKHRMLPFTQIGCIERPDSAYYLSPVQYLRPAQMELNKAHAQMLMGRENFTNFKWWVENSIELENDPDNSTAQILRGNSLNGAKPEILQAAAMPPTQDIDVLEQGMMHVVGQHEVSQAQVPGRVEAAKAIELLKESDAGAQATMRKTIKVSNSVGWFQALELARTFGKEEEMVLSYSREGIPEVKHFRAGELKPGYRVRTTMTTGLARSRASRQDLALRLWDSKAISDPDQLLELMEVPTGNMLQYRAADIRLARNENLVLAKEEAVTANSWDDHVIHLREHNAYRKTHEFHASSPEVKKKFEFHCQSHEALQMEYVTKQAQLQMVMQGQPVPSPTDAPPSNENPSTPEGTVQ